MLGKKTCFILLILIFVFSITGCSGGDGLKSKNELNITSVNGNISVTPNKDNYIEGEEIEIKANAEKGYHFKKWSGNIEGNQNPKTIVMTEDMYIKAEFEADNTSNTCTLTLKNEVPVLINDNLVEGGTKEYKIDVTCGTEIQLEAGQIRERIEPTTYLVISLDKWSGDIEGDQNPKTITVTEDMYIKAESKLTEE